MGHPANYMVEEEEEANRLIRDEFVLHASFLRVAGRTALLLLEVILPYLQLQFKLTLNIDR